MYLLHNHSLFHLIDLEQVFKPHRMLLPPPTLQGSMRFVHCCQSWLHTRSLQVWGLWAPAAGEAVEAGKLGGSSAWLFRCAAAGLSIWALALMAMLLMPLCAGELDVRTIARRTTHEGTVIPLTEEEVSEGWGLSSELSSELFRPAWAAHQSCIVSVM